MIGAGALKPAPQDLEHGTRDTAVDGLPNEGVLREAGGVGGSG